MDYIELKGAYWRNAFENPDYSEFADDEERELFVFVKVSPAESQMIQVGGTGSSPENDFVSLSAGNEHKIDSMKANYHNDYYQSLKDAGYAASPTGVGVSIEPPDDPQTFVSKFTVKGWEVKDADHVTLNIDTFYVNHENQKAEIEIPLDSIEPVVIDKEGQPTHPEMIEKMVEMAQE